MRRFIPVDGDLVNIDHIHTIKQNAKSRDGAIAFDGENRELGWVSEEDFDQLLEEVSSRLISLPAGWSLLTFDTEFDIIRSEPIIAIEVGQYQTRAICCAGINVVGGNQAVLRPDGLIDCGVGEATYPDVDAWKLVVRKNEEERNKRRESE